MIRAVVFDFDGTLVNSNAIKRQVFFDVVADDAGGAARMRAILARNTGDRYTLLAAYADEAASAGVRCSRELDELVNAYSERADTLIAEAPEMPGATALLRTLRQRGLRLFISSATPTANL